ncbi:BTB/POZ domain-containing protein 3-like [Mytilus californianus]|uniref:BTB/POZ domain-containing protein 3-like n=1 Tax=Mytilus californianus TaxID=6549 RepID=UPI002247D274|nr:BTB/POZ domain-containing protein 3-like [Mytilus californianus]
MASVYWQDYLSLKKALLHMFENKISCDVIFDIGSDEIPCHSFVLIARSHVFEANLDSPLVKLSRYGVNSMKKIELHEVVDTDGVKEFLRYLYTDDIDLGEDNVMTLLYLARKYMVCSLSEKCQSFITAASLDDPTNAVELYHQAFLLDITDVMEDSMKVINQSTKRCLESEAFLTLPPQCIRGLIADDHHQLDEDNIYRYVVQWCERRCEREDIENSDENYRKVLGDILYEIRFPNISYKFFKSSIERRNILTEREKKDLTNMYRNENRCTYRGIFKSKPRNVSERLMRMTDYEENLILDNANHSIAFTSSEKVLLHGIVTYGLSHEKQKFKIYVKLTDGNGKEIMNDEFWVKSKPMEKEYDVIFQKAVEIQPDIKFVISLELDEANWMWNGKNGIRSVYFNNSEIQFTDEPGTEETNTFQGQIPGIILS